MLVYNKKMTMEKMGKKFKEVFDKYTYSVVMSFVGVAFFVASFIVPPLGVIDSSVLTAIGELFGFTAAISGIHQYGQNARIKYNSTGSEES